MLTYLRESRLLQGVPQSSHGLLGPSLTDSSSHSACLTGVLAGGGGGGGGDHLAILASRNVDNRALVPTADRGDTLESSPVVSPSGSRGKMFSS